MDNNANNNNNNNTNTNITSIASGNLGQSTNSNSAVSQESHALLERKKQLDNNIDNYMKNLDKKFEAICDKDADINEYLEYQVKHVPERSVRQELFLKIENRDKLEKRILDEMYNKNPDVKPLTTEEFEGKRELIIHNSTKCHDHVQTALEASDNIDAESSQMAHEMRAELKDMTGERASLWGNFTQSRDEAKIVEESLKKLTTGPDTGEAAISQDNSAATEAPGDKMEIEQSIPAKPGEDALAEDTYMGENSSVEENSPTKENTSREKNNPRDENNSNQADTPMEENTSTGQSNWNTGSLVADFANPMEEMPTYTEPED